MTNVISFATRKPLETRYRVRWWPNASDAWMAMTFDDAARAETARLAILQEGARKAEVEEITG